MKVQLTFFNTRADVTHIHSCIHTSVLTHTPHKGQLEIIHWEKLLDIELVAHMWVPSCLFIPTSPDMTQTTLNLEP